MTALSASCQQQPPNGKRLSLDGSLFSSTPVNITDPLASSSAIASTFAPNPGPLTLGAKAGIAVGSLLALLILAGCAVVWRGKRRRRAVLAAYARRGGAAMQEVPRWKQAAATDDSPQSVSSGAFMAKPSNSWPWQGQAGGAGEESPLSATGAQGAQGAQQVWSPYVSQHASPVSAEQGARAQWGSVPIPRPYRRDSIGVLAEREREMWEREAGQVGFVPAPAPTIRHPGHGRKESFGEAI